MRWVVLALVGGLICTFGDHLHATHRVLAYPHIAFWDQAFWVGPLFAAASLACVLGARPFLGWARRRGEVRRPDVRQLAADGIGFFAAYAYTSFSPADQPNVTLAVLLIAFAVRVLAERRATWLVGYCLLLAVAGSLFEAGLSSTGAFYYHHPDFVVPRWLPGIYLHAGLIAGELSSWFLMSEGAAGPAGLAEQQG